MIYKISFYFLDFSSVLKTLGGIDSIGVSTAKTNI